MERGRGQRERERERVEERVLIKKSFAVEMEIWNTFLEKN